MSQPKPREVLLARRKMEEAEYRVIMPSLLPDDDDEWLLEREGREYRVLMRDHIFLEAVRAGEVAFLAGTVIRCVLEEFLWLNPGGITPEGETPEGVRAEYRVTTVDVTINPPRPPPCQQETCDQ